MVVFEILMSCQPLGFFFYFWTYVRVFLYFTQFIMAVVAKKTDDYFQRFIILIYHNCHAISVFCICASSLSSSLSLFSSLWFYKNYTNYIFCIIKEEFFTLCKKISRNQRKYRICFISPRGRRQYIRGRFSFIFSSFLFSN